MLSRSASRSWGGAGGVGPEGTGGSVQARSRCPRRAVPSGHLAGCLCVADHGVVWQRPVPEITREEVRLIFLWLMQIDGKLDEIREEDDGEAEAD